MTERDVELLKAVGDYRLLTAPQVQRLFFNSISAGRRRLFELWQHKLLDRRFIPVRPNEGDAPILYTLTARGARYLVAKQCVPEEAPPYTPFLSKGSSLFIEHTLRRNDFRVALTLACRGHGDRNLLWWRQDLGIKHVVTFPDPGHRSTMRHVSVLADGMFGIEHLGKKLYYFVEIDRATVSRARMLLRLKGYYHLWEQKRLHQKHGIPSFRVLIATSNNSRLRGLLELTRHISIDARGTKLFWFTTFNRYDTPSDMSNAIWQSAGVTAPLSLFTSFLRATPADAGNTASASTAPVSARIG